MIKGFESGERVIATFPEYDARLRKNGPMFDAGTVIEHDWDFTSVLFDNGARIAVHPEALEPLEQGDEDALHERIENDLERKLEQRGLQYGCFRTQASLSQGLKDVIRSGSSYDEMTQDQREAAEMICHKLARIANGNPSHWDSWHDIAGYAELIRKNIEGQDP